jgi:Spy/CpxP family protein refolding chaperone
MKFLNKMIPVIIAILAIAPMSWAQLMDQPPGGPPFGGPMRGRVRERIKTVKIWKLTEELNLTDEQSQKFFPIYNRFFDTREDIENQKNQLIQNLGELTAKENPSDSEINQQLNKIDSLDQRIQELQKQFRNDLKGVLTTRQIGCLYVFEIRFLRQMQDIIRDARQEMRGRGFGGKPGE